MLSNPDGATEFFDSTQYGAAKPAMRNANAKPLRKDPEITKTRDLAGIVTVSVGLQESQEFPRLSLHVFSLSSVIQVIHC
jgi:hypothetical protein